MRLYVQPKWLRGIWRLEVKSQICLRPHPAITQTTFNARIVVAGLMRQWPKDIFQNAKILSLTKGDKIKSSYRSSKTTLWLRLASEKCKRNHEGFAKFLSFKARYVRDLEGDSERSLRLLRQSTWIVSQLKTLKNKGNYYKDLLRFIELI